MGVPTKTLQNLFVFQWQRLQWSKILSSKSWFVSIYLLSNTEPPYTKHRISCSFLHQIQKLFANKCSFELQKQRNNVWGFDLGWVIKCSLTSLSTLYHSAFSVSAIGMLNSCFFFPIHLNSKKYKNLWNLSNKYRQLLW
jgi:hypothetical protein